MDSIGQLISLLDHRTFSERQLASVDRVVFAHISLDRLYLRIDLRGHVSDDWIKNSLRCSAYDGDAVYAKDIRIEDVIWREDDHVVISSVPVVGLSRFEGELPPSAIVVVTAGHRALTFTALNRVA